MLLEIRRPTAMEVRYAQHRATLALLYPPGTKLSNFLFVMVEKYIQNGGNITVPPPSNNVGIFQLRISLRQ